MVIVGVDGDSLKADSHPKSVGLIWRLAAAWHSDCICQNEQNELLPW